MSSELRSALELGQTERVLDLLKMGAPIIVDADGQTALHLAAALGHLDTVEALVQAGCDVGVQDFTGHTALQRAAGEGHLEIIRTLVKNGVSVDHQDEVHGNTALHECSWKGFSQSAQFLCKSKANPYIKNRGGFAALHLCCQNGHNETCRVLLLSGCKPDIKNNYGDTPLHTAARYGHAGVIRILVSAKCNTSEQNKNGDTALHIASAMGRRKLTRVLLESGCDRSVRNKQGETALDIATRKNLGDVTAILRNPPKVIVVHNNDLLGKSVDDSDVDAIRVMEEASNINNHNNNGCRDRKHRKQQQQRRRGGGHHRDHEDEYEEEEEMLLHSGEQYFMDLAGNIRKGPMPKSRSGGCRCGPAFQKFEKKLDRDKRDLIKHIDQSQLKLDSRLSNLEKKTKDQIFGLNQAMKESFAQERGECLDRMDRRALRERVAIERQQMIRDLALKRDLALWLDTKLTEIERRHRLDSKNSALLRAMATKRFAKYTAPGEEEEVSPTHGGRRLRRAHSEELVSECGGFKEDENNNRRKSGNNALRVSDHPKKGVGRTRRNSAGDESHVMDNLVVLSSPCDDDDEYNALQYNYDYPRVEEEEDKGQHELSDMTSSSLNTTVVAATEERRSQFGGGGHFENEYRGGLIRPIPGRPNGPQQQLPYQQQPQPYQQQQLQQPHWQQQQQWQQQRVDEHAPPLPGPKPKSQQHPIDPSVMKHQVQRQLFPMQQQQQEDDIQTDCYYSQQQQQQQQQFSRNSFTTFGFGKSMRQNMTLAPLEEVEYTSQLDLLQQESSSKGPASSSSSSSAEMLLHRQQLLNIPMTSEGSHDSHNDSGYSTRLGFSAGPSPSLSGSRPESSEGDHPQYQNGQQQQQQQQLLDPMAIQMMPEEYEGPLLQHSSGGSRIQEIQQRLRLNGGLTDELLQLTSPPHGSLV